MEMVFLYNITKNVALRIYEPLNECNMVVEDSHEMS